MDQVLDWLVEHDFQSDQRFGESLARQAGARQGVRKIAARLQSAGVAASLVGAQLDALRETEYARARELWVRKFGDPPADLRARAKQMRFLMARGFSAELAARVLRGRAED